MENTRFFIDYKALHTIFILIFALLPSISSADELNVYSGRKAALIKPLLQAVSKRNWHKNKFSNSESRCFNKAHRV